MDVMSSVVDGDHATVTFSMFFSQCFSESCIFLKKSNDSLNKGSEAEQGSSISFLKDRHVRSQIQNP